MASTSAADLFNVKGMVFVISGAGSGIGAMMAQALATNGASKVFILGRRLEKLQETAKLGVNSNITPIQCDVTSQSSLSSAVSTISAQTPFVNALIANSGITGPKLDSLPAKPTLSDLHSVLWSTDPAEFTETFNVNSMAQFYTTVAFLPLLDAGNTHLDSVGSKVKGGIKSQAIFTGSIAAFNRRATAGFAYGASKAAATHLMKMLALYLAPFKIRVNVLAPGIYPSEMTAHAFPGEDFTKEGTVEKEKIPLERVGSEEDMAGAILYLCSRAGAYVDGNALITDGGRLSQMPATY